MLEYDALFGAEEDRIPPLRCKYDLPIWMLWRRDGKKKVPHSAITHTPMPEDSPVRYTTLYTAYDAYMAAYENGTPYDGVMLRITDDIAVIDPDHSRNSDTGVIETWGEDYVNRFPTCWEISPSGTGLHGYVRIGYRSEMHKVSMTVANANHSGAKIELLTPGNMVTVTFNWLPGTLDYIAPLPNEVDALYHDLLRNGGKAHRNATGKQRITGNPLVDSYGSGDWSLADLLYCTELARRYHGDKALMDAAFRESGLYRAKWDEKRYADGRTYGEGRLDKALAYYRWQVLQQSATSIAEERIEKNAALSDCEKAIYKDVRIRLLYGKRDAKGFVRVNLGILAQRTGVSYSHVRYIVQEAVTHDLLYRRYGCNADGKKIVDIAISDALRQGDCSQLSAGRRRVGRPTKLQKMQER